MQKGNKMDTKEKYEIAIKKAKEVEKMQISEEKKQEIYSNLGEWVNNNEKELPFPFGKTPKKIQKNNFTIKNTVKIAVFFDGKKQAKPTISQPEKNNLIKRKEKNVQISGKKKDQTAEEIGS